MKKRIQSLDGWRGISILFVLASHLFPLGPSNWKMNSAIAITGMAIFFILSGFLITNIMLKNQNIISFLIRRFMRIIPLAWLVLAITFVFINIDRNTYVSHLLFYANWKPITLIPATSHYWSLCVEMQFYVLIAILVFLLRSKAFILLPIMSFAVTGYRYFNEVEKAINTYYRIDEILAGCILALLYNRNSKIIRRFFGSFNPVIIFPFLVLSAHSNGGWLNYLRPYIAMLIVGTTIFSRKKAWWQNLLNNNKFLLYIASISYSLYIIHGGLRYSWLGTGETIIVYLKRPLLLAVTFLLAHLSTFYYEKHWIQLGKRLSKNISCK